MANYVMEIRKLVGTRPLILPAAGVLLLDAEDRLLLMQRSDNNAWGIPGGGMELGESTEETARRELKEEVGLDAGALTLFNVYSGPEIFDRYPNGDEAYFVSAIYLCRDYSGTISVCPVEGKDAQFFPLDQLPENLNPTDRFPIGELVDVILGQTA